MGEAGGKVTFRKSRQFVVGCLGRVEVRNYLLTLLTYATLAQLSGQLELNLLVHRVEDGSGRSVCNLWRHEHELAAVAGKKRAAGIEDHRFMPIIHTRCIAF